MPKVHLPTLIMTKRLTHFFGLGLAIFVLLALLVSRGTFLGLQKGLQNKFYDFNNASSEIVIVAIDDRTVQPENLGTHTRWPRAHYAKAIELLNEQGAAAIGVDITFPDRSSLGEEDDLVFQQALEEHSNVVLATRYYFENNRRIPQWPNESILEASPTLGWINVVTDEDGFVRQLPIYSVIQEQVTEAFSLELARLYLNERSVGNGIKRHTFQFSKDIEIPINTVVDRRNNVEEHLMYVNYFAEPGGFRQVSFSNLLNERFVDRNGNPVDFEDKIVLIGPTARDLQDYYPSPVGDGLEMPGVEIHANNVQTLINQQFLRDQSALSFWLALLGLVAINLFLFGRLRVRFAIPLFLIELFAILVAGIVVYEFRILLNVVYPIAALLLSFIGTFILRYLLEQKDRQFIEGAFEHYVNPALVKQIRQDPKMLELGGAKRNVTVFFSDIQDFTSISEKIAPADLVHFLNSYLNEMTTILLRHEGTLDKYEGDAIMAFWGAPVEMQDHAKKACAAALDNQKRLAELRAEWKGSSLPEIHVRIGINTGEVIAGNMGSESRFDYTIMGDTVNLGSRLEGINKQYGTTTLISESTYELVKDAFVCREIDQIRVKGKEQPVRIFELMAKNEEANPEMKQVAQIFGDALNLYRQKNFLAAETEFKKLPNDPVSQVFVRRCQFFIKNPPAEGWDGVYTFTTK